MDLLREKVSHLEKCVYDYKLKTVVLEEQLKTANKSLDELKSLISQKNIAFYAMFIAFIANIVLKFVKV